MSGHTLGVSGTGYGQDLIQYFVIIAGAVAVGYTFEYLLCAGAIPGTSPTVASAGTPLDWLVGPLNAQPAAAGDPCIWEAWKAGIIAGMWQSVSVAWPLILKRFPFLQFFDRPLWATSEADPGDLPPLLGKDPCPPGAGGGSAPGAGAPPEGAPPKAAPPERPPAEPPPAEGPPAEPAPQPGEAAPAEQPMPQAQPSGPKHFDETYGDLPPIEPGEMEANVQAATAAANAARPQIGPARARLQEAEAAVEAAQQEYNAADAAAEADKESIAAAVRASKALDQVDAAKRDLAAAQTEAARLEQALAREAYAKRLQPLNDALYEARGEAREVQQRFAKAIQTGEADFQGAEYKQWQQAFDRYNQALKDYAKGYWNTPPSPQPSSGSPAPAGQGQTQPLGQSPTGPGQTQPLGKSPAGPGQTQPLGKSPAGPGQPKPAGPAPVGPSGGKAATVPLGNSPTCGAASPPPGSPPPGSPRPGSSPPPGSPPPGAKPPAPPSPPASTPAGRAPAGKGPFQGDPENREWLRQNWDPNPLNAHDAARPLGDPVIYDNADQAALARYNQARGQGMDDQAARQESWNEWWNSVQSQRNARGIYKLANNPFFEWVGDAPAPGTAPESEIVVGSGAAGGEP